MNRPCTTARAASQRRLHFRDPLAQWIGMIGLNAISKIISLLLAAIAVSMIRRGRPALA